ncbi:MAG: hypothetical protein ACYC3B_03020 [Sedimentisphaerales bacterium]
MQLEDMLEAIKEIQRLIMEKGKLNDELAGIEKREKEIRERLGKINSEIHTNAAILSEIKQKNTAPKPSKIPHKGIVYHIAEVMSETEPMSKEEIMAAMLKKGLVCDSLNSLRSYLSNMDCFEPIKKSDPRYKEMKKKGWICHKDMLHKNSASSPLKDGKTTQ